jgi:NAD(P)H-nitrite reductase large subunit
VNRYVLVGSGVASLAAAEAIRTVDRKGDILVIGDEPHGYYSRPGLAYVLTGELSEKNLYPMAEDDFRKLGVRRLHARVTLIQPQERLAILHNQAAVPYDKLLIAVGAEAQASRVPGVKLEGVLKLDNLDDARRIVHAARKARSAVVVGGGITALEIVEGLVANKVKTTYFLRGGRYWQNVLDETESRIVEHRLQEEGVEILFHTELEEILGKNGRVSGVRTKDGRELRCDLVAIAVGIRPRKELAEASGLQVERGVLVNEWMQSSVADIYAAGDVAQVFDPFTGKSVLDSLWGPARDQGFTAGLNMAGKPAPYYKIVPFNVTRLAGLTTTIIGTVGQGDDPDLAGIARGDSETWRQLPDAIAAQSNFDVNRLRVLVGQTTLLGALVIGDQTLSRPLQHIIANRLDISAVRDRLLTPGAPLADIIAEFWTHWKTRNALIPAQQP